MPGVMGTGAVRTLVVPRDHGPGGVTGPGLVVNPTVTVSWVVNPL